MLCFHKASPSSGIIFSFFFSRPVYQILPAKSTLPIINELLQILIFNEILVYKSNFFQYNTFWIIYKER